jgi:hypothetical protein
MRHRRIDADYEIEAVDESRRVGKGHADRR